MPLNRLIKDVENDKAEKNYKDVCLIGIDFLLRELKDIFQNSENPLAFCYRPNRESVFLFQK